MLKKFVSFSVIALVGMLVFVPVAVSAHEEGLLNAEGSSFLFGEPFEILDEENLLAGYFNEEGLIMVYPSEDPRERAIVSGTINPNNFVRSLAASQVNTSDFILPGGTWTSNRSASFGLARRNAANNGYILVPVGWLPTSGHGVGASAVAVDWPMSNAGVGSGSWFLYIANHDSNSMNTNATFSIRNRP